MTSKVVYNGQKRTTATHLSSGQSIITDAPLDNHGKGEAFSPTDLAATSLASCAMTIMGIYADSHGLNIDGTTAEVQKIMESNPRRIGGIIVNFEIPDRNFSDKEKKAIMNAALTCPVSFSLHPDLKQDMNFKWV